MQENCRKCGTSFNITDDDLALLDKISPTLNNKKISLPPPTLCFDCRFQRRLASYNARSLYKRTCDYSKKSVVSSYSPDKPFTIYHKDIWYSDQWDPLSYGQDFDFNRPFFPQIRELMEKVPLPNIAVLSGNVNSEFTNDNYMTKNCYMVFDGEQAESCYHGHTYLKTKNCLDFLHLQSSELCYECIHCYNSYNLHFGRYCHNCSDSWFMWDCIGCRNCFGCTNLRQKQYCIFNEQKTQAEFEAFMDNFESSKYSVLQQMIQKCQAFQVSKPVRAIRGEKKINCVGDNINNSQNAYWCFDCNEHRDTRYCTDALMSTKDSMDIHIWGKGMELCYNCVVVGDKPRNVITGYYNTEGISNVYYSLWCSRNSHDLLGCIGLRHSEYCIFNKKYSFEEYQTLAAKIVEHMQNTGEWGEYFPPEISKFGYNETMAQSFMPLTKEEAIGQGFLWSDYQAEVLADKSILASKLPDDSQDVPDDILNWAIICEATGKPFKLLEQELEFYRNHKLPIPRRHPDERHLDRFKFKNPYKLWNRNCTNCGQETMTSYSPERPEVVWCEKCYLKEVY